MPARPVIIEVAQNGGLPKHVNPRVPRTEDEIVLDAIACIGAGASIVHNHNDEAVIGGPAAHDAAPYRRIWRRVREVHPDVIFYPTMASGGPGIEIAVRYAHIESLARSGDLDLGLVDPGTTNVGRFDADGVPLPDPAIYQNSFADAVHMVESCRRNSVGLSISIFEPGFVRVVRGFADAGRLPAGALIKFYFGGARAGFGLPPTAKALEAYLEMIEGTGLPWLVSVQGGDVVGCGIARMAIERGGHVQVGLEPSGDRTRTNIELVAEAAALVTACGGRPATCREARQVIGLG